MVLLRLLLGHPFAFGLLFGHSDGSFPCDGGPCTSHSTKCTRWISAAVGSRGGQVSGEDGHRANAGGGALFWAATVPLKNIERNWHKTGQSQQCI
jgi:hypothetical protein